MVTYSFKRSGLLARYDVELSIDGETRHGRLEQRGHSCLAGVITIAIFAMCAAGLPYLVIRASESVGMAHPFDMDRHSLWFVGASMIFVGGLSFYVAAFAGKLIDPQFYRMTFEEGSESFEVVSRAAMTPGISGYVFRDQSHGRIANVEEEHYSGRVLLKRSFMPEVVISYLDDKPAMNEFHTGEGNRANYWYIFGVMFKFLLLAPLMLISPIWISVTRKIPNDSRRRRVWMIDPVDPSKLLEAGGLTLHYDRDVLRGAVLIIDAQAMKLRHDIVAAASILFVDMAERPREMQAK